MVFLVPYDGSNVAEAALDRAVQHGEAFEEDVLAVSFIPTGAGYAERRKWIKPEESFAVESARAELKRKIEEATDDAERNYTDSSASGMQNGVADKVRRIATEVDAATLFVGVSNEGSDGRLETPFGTIAREGKYDVHIVR